MSMVLIKVMGLVVVVVVAVVVVVRVSGGNRSGDEIVRKMEMTGLTLIK